MNNVTKTLSSKSESEISHTHSNKQDDFITISVMTICDSLKSH
jgi:hypothetical protein